MTALSYSCTTLKAKMNIMKMINFLNIIDYDRKQHIFTFRHTQRENGRVSSTMSIEMEVRTWIQKRGKNLDGKMKIIRNTIR